jgi:hypothetical protein
MSKRHRHPMIAAVATALTIAVSPAATAASAKVEASQLRADMRKLWEDHVTWTRLYIVSVAAGLPDKDLTAQRLLQNQVDIGNAIKPFYGDDAGNKLTALLKEHILGAADDHIKDYDQIHDHILRFADVLTNGIAAQFPDRVHKS